MKKYIEVIKEDQRILIDVARIVSVSEFKHSRLPYSSQIECDNGMTLLVDTCYLDIKHELLK